jgi:sec-independent protein translocase protein TatA
MAPLAFGFGNPGEWMIILIVALIVFGPKKLPEVGKQLGHAMREFRKMADDLTGAAHSVKDEFESAYKPVLTPPHTADSTSSATVEQAMAHRPYDQEPEDLMAPAVPEVPKPAQGGLTLSTLPPEAPEDAQAAAGVDAKG